MMRKNGHRKKKRLWNVRVLKKEVNGRGSCLTVPSGLKPCSRKARCQGPLDFISRATKAGVFPSSVSANLSDPNSINFEMQWELPFTKAQCKAVKPFSSFMLTLAPHWSSRSTQAANPLYAAHIRHVWPDGSGPSTGIFWWRSMRRRKTLPSNVARWSILYP